MEGEYLQRQGRGVGVGLKFQQRKVVRTETSFIDNEQLFAVQLACQRNEFLLYKDTNSKIQAAISRVPSQGISVCS